MGVGFRYTCCSFRGNMLALNAKTGQMLCNGYSVSQATGAGLDGVLTPAIDHKRGSIDGSMNHQVPPVCTASAAWREGRPGPSSFCPEMRCFPDIATGYDRIVIGLRPAAC